MTQERILKEAAIAPHAVRYQVLPLAAVLAVTVVGIPIMLVAVPVAHWYWSRFYERLRVVLTARELKVHRGILVTEEKSIPLEKITDLAVFQGPIMRWMNLKGIRIETAGQSTGPGALVSIVGLADTDEFRDMVLRQRDRVNDRDDGPKPAPRSSGEGAQPGDQALLEVATEIRDALYRIEQALPKRS